MTLRRTAALGTGMAALALLVLAALVMSGAAFQWRVGPVRIRISEFLRPLLLSAASGGATLWLSWASPVAKRASALIATLWLLVALAGYASTASSEFVPVSDIAVIESYTIHATEGRLFVGPYSRFAWHHPGPLLFYVLAPFYALSGHRSAGLAAGALALNLLSLLAIVGIAVRSGRAALAAVAGVLTVAFVWRAGEMVASQWNPHVLVLPTMALFFLCAETIAGRLRLLPLVAIVASFVVQTHVGLVPVVVATAGASMVATFITVRRDEHGARRWWWAVNMTGWVLTAAWLLPLAEQLYRTPGNLSELWRFFAIEQRTGQTFGVALRAWSDMLSALFRPDFQLAWGSRLRASAAPWSQAFALGQVVLLAAIAVRAVSARQRFRAALAWVLLIATLVALWSVTRVEDDLYDHAVFWIAGLGVLNTAVLLDAGFAALLPARAVAVLDRWRGQIAAGIVVAGAVVGISRMADVVERSFEPNLEQLAAQRLAAGVEEHMEAHGACKPLVRIDHPAWPIAAGILVALQRERVPFAVEDGWLPMFSDAVAARGDETCVMTIVWPQERLRLERESNQEVMAERGRITIFLSRVPPS